MPFLISETNENLDLDSKQRYPLNMEAQQSGPGRNLNRNVVYLSEDVVADGSLITHEHSLQLVENLRKIYEEEDCYLHDVVLVSNDGGEVKAHKIILAAQSDYFKVN